MGIQKLWCYTWDEGVSWRLYQAGLVGCEEESVSPTLRFPLNMCPLPLNENWLKATTFLATFMVSLKAHHQLCPVPFQFSSVAQSCLTLCDPMGCSTPGLSVHPQLPEFTQTHVHRVGDAIQPSHPLLPPSVFPSIRVFSNKSALCIRWPKYWEFQLQHQSFQWTLRTDLLYDGLVGSPCSPRDSQESSLTPQVKSINSSALSFLHSPTLTSIHDHWKNHSLD